MTVDELAAELEVDGINSKFGLKLAYWVYKKRIDRIPEIKNISKEILRKISDKYEPGLYPPSEIVISSDKTEKYLFCTDDGRRFEAVFIPDKERKTLCVSSQAGCRMGCLFCMTGKSGFNGNLTAGEIINQILSTPHAGEITNIVFMGMGEPMDNLQEVIRACNIISSQWGLALGAGNVTVSTVGITEGIKEFLEKSNCNLTLSLHSPFPEERSAVIPVESRYPFSEILEILKANTGLRRRISVAYIMIAGVNDTDNHLNSLRELLLGTGIRVNILPYNMTPDSDWVSSTYERMHFFKHNLITSGISASIRKSRGDDISAACGLLAGAKNPVL